MGCEHNQRAQFTLVATGDRVHDTKLLLALRSRYGLKLQLIRSGGSADLGKVGDDLEGRTKQCGRHFVCFIVAGFCRLTLAIFDVRNFF